MLAPNILRCGQFRSKAGARMIWRFFSIAIFLNLTLIQFALGAGISKLPPMQTDTVLNGSIVLGAGHSTRVAVPAHVQLSLSNGSILRIRDLGSELQVTGLKSGIAAISYGTKTVQVDVLSESRFKLYSELKLAMNQSRGLEISAEGVAGGGRIFVNGRLLRIDDWRALARVARDSHQEFQFRASLDPEIRETALTYFRQLALDAGLPDLSLEFSPTALVMIPKTPADLKLRVEHVLQPYGFVVETSESSLALEPSIRVKVIVAEIKKDLVHQLGIHWPSSVSAQLLPPFTVSTPNADGTSTPGLQVNIDALEEQGLGKVLASPTLLCRSGKEADFLAGGEFPIRTTTQYAASVSWKKYGVMLHINPQADYSGRMSIGINTEVSMLDFTNKAGDTPGLLTNSIQTHFDLTHTRTIALSGLLREEWGRAQSGLPFLSQLPILGSLFSSHNYHDHKTELIVFVTPTVSRPDEEVP